MARHKQAYLSTFVEIAQLLIALGNLTRIDRLRENNVNHEDPK